jgi:hypothetical protein
MGRIYAVPFTATVTAAGTDADLWEFQPADDRPVKLRGFRLGQISEVKDAQEEGLRITVKRLLATVTSGSGGSAGAPEEVAKSAQAPGFASETNNATVATTTGDTEVLDEIGWLNRNTPFEVWYPDERFSPGAKQPEALVIRLETTLVDDMTFCGTAWVEEEA